MTRARLGLAVVALVGGLAIVPARALAQAPDALPGGQDVLRVHTNMIVLHVSVRDSHGQPVAGLPCDAFTVYEDGAPQEISICEPGAEPMTLGLVIDSSTSMARYRTLLATAAAAFVRLGNADNDVFLIQFNEKVRNALAGKRFTSDPDEVARGVLATATRGRTALFDALWDALDVAEQGNRLKKAIVLVSDGGDNASTRTFEEVLDRARRGNVAIFCISISDGYDTDARPRRLRDLAQNTGGLVFETATAKQVDDAFAQIGRDLQGGYTLGYVPGNDREDGGFRTVRVAVRAPGAEGRLSVRTRSGYLAAGPGHDSRR